MRLVHSVGMIVAELIHDPADSVVVLVAQRVADHPFETTSGISLAI